MSSSIEELIYLFSRLPGLGPKSSRRIVLHLLKDKNNLLNDSIRYLTNIKQDLKHCICGNIDIQTPCYICRDNQREKNKICVVEEISDLWAIEKTNTFKGNYHVLGGILSAVDGIGPEELNLGVLFEKCKKEGEIKEIILATNSTMEGQLTAQYIAEQLLESGVFVTRLAHGMPIGSELDFIDEGTLSTAFKLRSQFK